MSSKDNTLITHKDSGQLSESSDDHFQDASSDCAEHCTLDSLEWTQKKKHIFILSESGKPIYTRYGQEDNLVTLYGLLQALVSIVMDDRDVLHCVEAQGHKFVFLVKSPLILAAVDSTDASTTQLLLQLMYVNAQVESVSTRQALTRTYSMRPNCDLRELLGGTDRLLNSLLELVDCEVGPMIGAYSCLPLSQTHRQELSQAVVTHCSKIKGLVLAVTLVRTQVVSVVRLRGVNVHPMDLLLLCNLVRATESLRTSEHWMPICLPQFDPNGYLYGHVSYLSDDCDGCLLLLTVQREDFFVLSQVRQQILEKLQKLNILDKLVLSPPEEALSPAYTVRDVGCPQLRHFAYKSKLLCQYTAPPYSLPYDSSPHTAQRLYSLLHDRLHSEGRPLRMLYSQSQCHASIGWVTEELELYALLEPLTTKHTAIAILNKILKFVRQEETRLFLLNDPTF